jgi:TetR/AcrR family fatty acid metabolism transcriptional regulator
MPKIKDEFKEQLIIQSAIKIISEKGYFRSTISNIAKEANVADGTIYTYFKNKEELLIKSFEYVLENILNEIIENIKEEKDIFGKIKVIIKKHLEFMYKNPDIANFLQIQLRQSKREIRNSIKNIMRKYYSIIGGILKEGIEQGRIRNDVNLRVIGHMIFGTVDEIVTSWILAENRCDLVKKEEDILKLVKSAIMA